MNQLPLVSVIIPVYNCEEFIEECLDSIIAQSIGFDKLEVILVDDTSPCNAKIIIKEKYLGSYPNMFLHENDTNQGPGGSRNIGVKMAKAELITFVDADDWCHENLIEKLYNNYLEHAADITVCGMMNTLDGVNPRWSNIPPKGIYINEDKLDLLFTVKVECHSVYRLISKALFTEKKLWYRENAYYEDTALLPQLFYHSNKISCIEDVLYYYRFNPSSIVNTSSDKHIEDINLAWKDLLENIPLNSRGIHFFWWLFAHNIFKKRRAYLDSLSFESLKKFLSGFFKLLDDYPILLHGMVSNSDTEIITSTIKLLNEKHNNRVDEEIQTSLLSQIKKEVCVKGMVSIIMPVHNTVSYIKDAISSVVNQSYSNIEVIIVNDCSNDGTKEILDSIDNSKIKIVNLPENSGAYFSRNIGLLIARGEYITTVDSDDVISYERIEQFVDLLASNENLKLVEGRFIRHNEDGILQYKLFTRGVGGSFFRKSIVEELGYFFPTKGGSDNEYSDRVGSFYGKGSTLVVDQFTYWAIERSDALTSINPQNSISRGEFVNYYKSIHAKKEAIKVEFPWRINNDYVHKILKMEIGRTSYLEKIQDIKIKVGEAVEVVSYKKDLKAKINAYLSQGIGHYYSEFILGKEYIQKLERKLKDKGLENLNIVDSKSAESSLQENLNHYNQVYEKMPKWWKKLGALIRKLQ